MQSGTEFRIIIKSKVNFDFMYKAVSSFKKLHPELWAELTPKQQRAFGKSSSERSYNDAESNLTPMLLNVFSFDVRKQEQPAMESSDIGT